jgi:hypothetical protein
MDRAMAQVGSRRTFTTEAQGRYYTSLCGIYGEHNGTTTGLVGRDSSVGIGLSTGWTVRGSNAGRGEIFRTCPDRPWVLPSLLYSWYRIFPGGKAAGTWS